MSIDVNIPPLFQYCTNSKEAVTVNGNTVGECLKQLVEQFPAIEKTLFDERGELFAYLTIFINERVAYPEKLTMPVKDRDKIYIVPVIVGG